jgi:hypothetical protein
MPPCRRASLASALNASMPAQVRVVLVTVLSQVKVTSGVP